MATVGLIMVAMVALCMHETIGKRVAPNGNGLAAKASLLTAPAGVFDITLLGVKHKDTISEDGTDSLNGLALGRAWNVACQSKSPGGVARLVIPKGEFVVGPTNFNGPCNSKVTIDIQGTLKPNKDGSVYFNSDWITVTHVDGVTITGSGTIDGQGKKSYENCAKDPSNCDGYPNIILNNVTNLVIDGVNSINPTFAHVYVELSRNVTIRNMKMKAPENSIRTDGVFITESESVTVSNNTIATGTECVIIAHGSKNIVVTDLHCGPGNGISVGSFLAHGEPGTFMNNLLQVEGVVVKKCNLVKTTNGLTIKTLLGAKGSKVSTITFEDLVMKDVKNPINILQEDKKNPTLNDPGNTVESVPVKISNIHFKNIKGSSATRNLINLTCNGVVPCEGIEIADVDVAFDEKAVIGTAPPLPSASCVNAKVIFNGKHDGINC